MTMPKPWLEGYQWASGESDLSDMESDDALEALGYDCHLTQPKRDLWWQGVTAFYREQDLCDISPDAWAGGE